MLEGLTPDPAGCGPVAMAFQEWPNGVNLEVLRRACVAENGHRGFPGGSRGRVNRAGNNVRDDVSTLDDLVVIDVWREAHRPVLNTFQAILRNRTRDTGVVVAQRHKRKRTIFDKLRRYPRMQLSRMDDVAGCRLIFNDLTELREFRERFHNARFNHKLRNEPDRYDYIRHPKESGYRGIHDVYSYNVNSEAGRPYEGLLIELQYRTLHQHAWATCVEIVGFLTENQPKFDRGDDRYLQILRLASEIIARAFEGERSCLHGLDDAEVVQQFLALDASLHFLQMLRGLNAADGEIRGQRNVILIFSEDEELETRSYRDAPEALRALFELERENPGKDIVLVKADTSEEVRIAFRNYFSDASEFIQLMEIGVERLSPDRVVYLDAEILSD